jgi:hypothetical protein
MPAKWQIDEFYERRIVREHLMKSDDPSIFFADIFQQEKLPAAIITIMGYVKHRCPILDNLSQCDYGKIGWVAKWPRLRHHALLRHLVGFLVVW